MNLTLNRFKKIIEEAQTAGKAAADEKYDYLKQNHQPIFEGLYDSQGGVHLYIDAQPDSDASVFLKSIAENPISSFAVERYWQVSEKRKKLLRFKVEMKYGGEGYWELSVKEAAARASLNVIAEYVGAAGWASGYGA